MPSVASSRALTAPVAPVLFAALVALAASAGCASRPLHVRAEPLPQVAVLDGRVTTTGATATTAEFTSSTGSSGARSCGDAARRGNAQIVTPRFVVSTGSSTIVYAGPSVADYHGPGSYGGPIVRLDDLLVVTRGATVDFRRTATSVVTMTVRADASGEATFSGYRDAQGRILSGSLRWSCATHAQL